MSYATKVDGAAKRGCPQRKFVVRYIRNHYSVSERCAYYLAKLFKGCEWLGHIEVPGVEQLGHLAELGTKTTDARREAPKARGGRPRKYRSDEDRKKARAAAARKRRAETA